MTMTIEQMQNNIIRKYGFEHNATIFFFTCCDDYFEGNTNEKSVRSLYDWMMKKED